MQERELICIGCPMGCMITVSMNAGEVLKVTGNTCRRGEIYARKEVTNPTRILTGSVRVKGGMFRVVSVKTKEDISKEKITACMKELKKVEIDAPVEIGDIILKDIAGTGVDIIATKQISVCADNG